jgi:hypothetical protein
MMLFRTATLKRRHSFAFLKTPAQQAALQVQLTKQRWIEEIFSRQLPIPKEFETRFGPQGFLKNPFYASSNKETTFYEFGYGLLKRPSFVDLTVKALCFEVRRAGTSLPLDVAPLPYAPSLLSPTSYEAAHKWLSELQRIPESIRYPSVRDPNLDRINWAIYEPSAVLSTLAFPEDIEFTPKADGSVEVLDGSANEMRVIKPIRTLRPG